VADNVFSSFSTPQATQGSDPSQAGGFQSTIEGISRKTRVPANFLMAFAEQAAEGDEAQRSVAAERMATQIAPRLAAGEKIEDVVRALASDRPGEADAFIERAYQIADAVYPSGSAPQAPGVDAAEGGGMSPTDPIKQVAGSAVASIGSGIAGSMRAMGAEGDGSSDWQKRNRAYVERFGDWIASGGDALKGGVSADAKRALQESTPDGDLFSPSTWSLGNKPSLKGYAMLAADVLGSFLPVVVTAVATKSPAATAAVGGLQGGGAASDTARQVIVEAAGIEGASGKSVLEEQSAFYRDLLAQGKTPDEALQATVDAAEQISFTWTAPISAFGGATTEKILGHGIGALATKGPLSRILGTAALSGFEEGAQEASESIATRYGIKSAGLDVSLTDGTFGDFLMGALGGGPVGAVSGAIPT